MRPSSLPNSILPSLVRHYSREGGRHAHEHAQVLFGLEGRLEMDVEGRRTWVDPSCGLVVPAGTQHSYRATTRARVLVLDTPACRETSKLRSFALQPGWLNHMQVRGLDRSGLLHMLHTAPTLATRRPVDLDELAAQVDADLARPWTVADLAAACCLSPQRLRARFAQAAGQSPLDFVRSRRLDRATHLLRQGLGLEAVALQVGYSGAPALSAALRRSRNTGARALRQALRES